MTGLTSTNSTQTPSITSTDIHAQTLSTLNQLENQRKVALQKGDGPKADRLFTEQVLLAYKAGLLDDGKKLQAKMMELVPDLRSTRAKAILNGGVDAQTKMLDEQHEANLKKQVMYQDQVDRMYQSRLATAEGPARLLASFKGFALLLQSFGVDCSEFIAECDKKIEAEYAKVPKKSIEGLSGVNAYTVDPTQPAQAVLISGNLAEQDGQSATQLAETANQAAIAAGSKILGGVPSGTAQPAAPAEEKPVGAKSVATALGLIIQEKKLITGGTTTSLTTGLEKGVNLSAAADGNAATVSAADIDSLAFNTQKAINKNGGHVDAATAMQLAKEAIDRARRAEAGAPAPQPS